MRIQFRIKFLAALFLCFGSVQLSAQRYLAKTQKSKQLGPINVPTPMGPENVPSAHGMGLVQSLYVSTKTPGLILAGSNSGGIYRTDNDGKNWYPLNNFGLVTGVLDIEVDPQNENEIWIATGTVVTKEVFGHGILHSMDGGKTWEKTGIDFDYMQQQVVWQIARSKSDPNVFYCCTQDAVYRSRNRAKTWRKVLETRKGMDFRELIVNPSNPDYVVASGEEIFVSTDGGKSWKNASEGLQFRVKNLSRLPNRIAVGLVPNTDEGIVVLYKAGSRNYIEMSPDWGDSWQTIANNRRFNRVDKANAEIAIANDYAQSIYVGCVRMYKSTNGGNRFEQITFPMIGNPARVHDDIREMVLIDGNTVYVGCDGGVSRTKDGGKTWQDLSGEGLTITQFYGVTSSPTERYMVMGGCQDLSSIIIDKEGSRSTGHIYGDGGNCMIDSANNWYILQNGIPRKSINQGETWGHLQSPFHANSYDYPFQLDPKNHGYFYMADHHLFKSDGKSKPINLTPDIPKSRNKIRELDINLGNPKYMMLAKDEPTWDTGDQLKGKLYRSNWSSGKPDSIYWEDITKNLGLLAWHSVSGITSHSNDPNKLWVSLFGSPRADGLFRVMHSTDRGNTWNDYSQGLSFYNTHEIIHVKGSKEALFLATDNGLYFRNHQSDGWIQLKGDLPQIMIRDISIYYPKRRLRVATYGGGIWEMKLPRKMLR